MAGGVLRKGDLEQRADGDDKADEESPSELALVWVGGSLVLDAALRQRDSCYGNFSGEGEWRFIFMKTPATRFYRRVCSETSRVAELSFRSFNFTQTTRHLTTVSHSTQASGRLDSQESLKMADAHTHDSHNGGHSHDHGHSHGHSHGSALRKALVVTLIFMVLEAVGGYMANSLALVSDAAHMLTDAGALLLSLCILWLSRRPSTPVMSFGYHRLEILGALASGLVIWVLAGFLVYAAVQRMSNPPEVQGPMVFVIATIGLLANLASMKFLHGAQHHSMNVRAAYLHVIADCLGSVGAMIAGGVLWWTGWRPIDPIITVIFSALMLFSSWDLVKESLGVLMESAPRSVNPELVQGDLAGVDGVTEVHDLHIWTVSSGRLALSVHLISRVGEAVLTRANDLLSEKYGIHHTTIQIEHPDQFQSEKCYDCETGT